MALRLSTSALWDFHDRPHNHNLVAGPWSSFFERSMTWGRTRAQSSCLSTGRTTTILRSAEATAQPDSKELSEEALVVAARAQAAAGLGTLAHPEETKVDLDQIVLSAETRTLLDELLSYARHREELVAEWGFATRCPTGWASPPSLSVRRAPARRWPLPRSQKPLDKNYRPRQANLWACSGSGRWPRV